jgi:protein TonB
VEPNATAEAVRLVLPAEVTAPIATPPEPAPGISALEQAGDPNGSPNGVPEGMENGAEDGEPGGVPWGRRGGRPGGTGWDLVPVSGVERPPRLVRQTKPVYPQEAFRTRVDGEVLLEIVIDAYGKVAQARVLRSIPLLDASAIEAVYEWRFEPALKHGRPVPALGRATVRFSLL